MRSPVECVQDMKTGFRIIRTCLFMPVLPLFTFPKFRYLFWILGNPPLTHSTSSTYLATLHTPQGPWALIVIFRTPSWQTMSQWLAGTPTWQSKIPNCLQVPRRAFHFTPTFLIILGKIPESLEFQEMTSTRMYLGNLSTSCSNYDLCCQCAHIGSQLVCRMSGLSGKF